MDCSYDAYIQDYLFFDFREMASDKIPRDLEKEASIARASRIEFLLQKNVTREKATRLLDGDFSAELHFFDDDRFGSVLYNTEDGIKAIQTQVSLKYDINPKTCPIHTPLLNLYVIKHPGMSYDAAMDELERTMPQELRENISRQVEIKPLYLEDRHIIHRKFRSWLDVNGMSASQIHLEYSENKKVILRSFRNVGFNTEFFFSPYNATIKSPIFNWQHLHGCPKASVILTDAIDLAIRNQSLLWPERADIVWISWYGGIDAIGHVDWGRLQSRRVYYLLKEHSGFNVDETCRTALRVGEMLKQMGITIQYISYLHGTFHFDRQSGVSQRPPAIVPVETVQQLTDGTCQSTSPSFQDFRLLQSMSPEPRRMLFSPYLYEKTITLLHGNPASGKTTFALSLALALSQGATLFDGWQAKMQAYVLYFHAKTEGSASLQELLPIVKDIKFTQLKFAGTSNPSPYNGNVPETDTQQSYFFGWEMADGPSNNVLDAKASFLSWLTMTIQNSFLNRLPPQWPKLVVLDGFHELASLANDPARNVFLRELKKQGCAILIIPPSDRMTPSKIDRLKKAMPVDSAIKIEADDTDDATMGMLLHIERGFKIGRDDTKLIKVKFDSSVPKWQIVNMKRPWKEEMALVAAGLKKGMTSLQIARSLAIGEPLVKLRIRQIQGKVSKPKKPSTPPILQTTVKKIAQPATKKKPPACTKEITDPPKTPG